MKRKMYDVIGIGLGPFNLGLAALLEDVEEIDGIFFEQQEDFEWHPGMLMEGTDLQDPFLVDLVTFANPRSPFTFLNYLHENGRLYAFYYFRQMNIPRKEYNAYAKWVGSKLEQARYGHRVLDVNNLSDSSCYEVSVELPSGEQKTFHAKHVVLGTGAVPNLPGDYDTFPGGDVLHSSEYLYHEKEIKKTEKIALIGSGQSAAEIFLDLLQAQRHSSYEIAWYTRSAGIFQLEGSKLGKEFFSPEYVNYFHSLSFETRQNALSSISKLRHGIDMGTIDKIYQELYHHSAGGGDPEVVIQPLTALENIEKGNEKYMLSLHQHEKDETFSYEADKVILATGYKPNLPGWLMQMEEEIVWEDDKLFKVTDRYQIVFNDARDHHLFTLTNLEHADGAGATNLGLSVQRNQKIINTIAGRDVYPIPEKNTFQRFTNKK